MKTLNTQKRLAAEALGVGRNKVVFDSHRLDDIREAITKADIKELIKDNAIKKKPFIIRKNKKVKKKKKKTGKIRKKVNKRKQEYVIRIRKLRKYLTILKKNKVITTKEYAKLRKIAKTGQLKSLGNLKEYLTTVMKINLEGGKRTKEKPKKERKEESKKEKK